MNSDSIATGKLLSSSSESLRTIFSHEPLDMFGDDFGEPLLSQRIVMDFTPSNEDNDIIQRKCVAFWEFVSRNSELTDLKTYPDYNVFEDSSSQLSSFVPLKAVSSENVLAPEKTAVSMLELVEEKGLIDRAFEGKIAQSYCSLGLREYSEDESIPVAQDKDKREDEKRKTKRRERNVSNATVKKMCNKLQKWTSEHPKYMEPPGHSQTLIHCKRRKQTRTT